MAIGGKNKSTKQTVIGYKAIFSLETISKILALSVGYTFACLRHDNAHNK